MIDVRFWSNVDKSGECWLWTGTTISKGYGWLNRAGGHRYAHRYSFEMANGPIPDGMCVCHRCDTPACVRPDHLFLGTVADNNADMRSKGRAVTPPRRPLEAAPRGEDHPRARLTSQDIFAIREAYAGGLDSNRVAARFGISRRHVINIVNRKSWRHVQ